MILPNAIRLTGVSFAIGAAMTALPAATQLHGDLGYTVFGFASVIALAWHYVGMETGTSDRARLQTAGAILVALAFSGVELYGVIESGKIKPATEAATAAKSTDDLYTQQEQERMATLKSLRDELRSTSKREFPGEYARLQDQIDANAAPLPRNASATQIANGLQQPASRYNLAFAVMMVLIAPALMLLAGFIERQRPVNTASTALTTALTSQNQQHTETQLTPVNALSTQSVNAVNTASTADNSLSTDDNSPLTALLDREITPTEAGLITAAIIAAQTGCTERQARAVIRDAWHAGALEKEGDGNATRYRYAKPTLRAVK